MMPNNIYVMGLEPFNENLLRTLPQSQDSRFLNLLGADEAVEVEPGFRLSELRARAHESIQRQGPPDAILNYWDFPGACLAPLLCKDLGLPGPSLEAVARCEHKYWARREMQQCVPEVTPRFQLIDPFDADAAANTLPFPFWLKPLLSHSSYLGFHITSKEDLSFALAVIRQQIAHFGDPFNEFLQEVALPPEIAGTGGLHCIAEEIISTDHQVTLEGWSHGGEVGFLGCIDSIREGQAHSSFARYDYPSHLPGDVLERMKRAADTLVRHIELDNSCFNVEFFWDSASGRISLVEINSRISKSHSPLFLFVDGCSNQAAALDIALDRRPAFPRGRGDWPRASKFMLRLFQDAEIIQIPHAEDIRILKARYPETLVQVLVTQGQRLSHLAFQDSYSFEIADLFFGGRDELELFHKYSRALDILPFEIHLTAPLRAAQ